MLIALAVIGYYVYQQYLGAESEAPPSCRAALNACIANCRKTTTEAPENQACQQRCRSEAAACEAESGSGS
ncbi:MAG TPA: hypothetical protein VF211_04320 [Burkholderiales bacterium]